MSSTSKLAEFAARVRAMMRAFTGVVGNPAGGMPSFDQLALELFGLQFERNAAYRRFCEARQAGPENVRHWTAIPAVPANAFKEWELSCLRREERSRVFHSSGTTGQRPGRHFHNGASLEVYEASLWGWFGAQFPMANGKRQMAQHSSLGEQWMDEGETEEGRGRMEACEIAHSQRPTANALEGGWRVAILTPPPVQAPHSSLIHMFETIRRELGAGEASCVGRAAEDGGWSLELEAAIQLLGNVSDAGQPLLVLGTAFSFVQLLDHLVERRLRFAPAPGSCALETGGYKGRSRALPKGALHALIWQRLGIPQDHIICEYGMSELSSQAYDCPVATEPATPQASRCFRFPPWARAQIISPETGCEVGEGETGLIRIFDLANVWSVMAIQTEDLGVRHGDGFTLAGRAVRAELRGCSLMAV